MRIGEIILAKREAKKLTQEQLASAVGVSKSMICQIERGSKSPTIGLGKAIADVLGCTLDELAE
jgi:transcriptional regulator with XRE-family HTH domain